MESLLILAASVNPITVVWSVVILLAISVLFGLLLGILGKKLAVHRDERIDQVKEKLSGANCGSCGYPGCDGFAQALVEGKADISACSSTSAKKKKEIGEILGVSVSAEDTKVVVCCRGGNRAQDKYEYMGYGDCRSMELLSGGRKLCKWGCLGMGSCVDACHDGAIEVGPDGYTQIDRSKCIACGRCINVCPKKLIKRVPVSAVYYVACSNCLRGKDAMNLCTVGCIGCGLCARNCPNGAIEMVNNLPVIDYSKCTACGKCAEKCPRKTIIKCDE